MIVSIPLRPITSLPTSFQLKHHYGRAEQGVLEAGKVEVGERIRIASSREIVLNYQVNVAHKQQIN